MWLYRKFSWFQTSAVFWMLYAFFWAIPRRLNFICRRFGTLCSIVIGGWVWRMTRFENVGVFIRENVWLEIRKKKFCFIYSIGTTVCPPLTLRLLMPHIYIYMEHLFLVFLDHTQRHSTVGRTPLDEWSARRRHLYLTTHDTHNRQISMPPVGFEPKISAGERPVCIVIYSYNKSQLDALFLNFILVKNSTCFGQICFPSSGVLILYSH